MNESELNNLLLLTWIGGALAWCIVWTVYKSITFMPNKDWFAEEVFPGLLMSIFWPFIAVAGSVLCALAALLYPFWLLGKFFRPGGQT